VAHCVERKLTGQADVVSERWRVSTFFSKRDNRSEDGGKVCTLATAWGGDVGNEKETHGRL